jgi:hypothetical protein
MKKRFGCILVLSFVSAALSAQTKPSTSAPAQQPSATASPAPVATAARHGDVDSAEHIIAALYDVISGPAGKRDWDRFRSLFYPGARLIPTVKNEKGEIGARVLSPDEYSTRSQAFFDREGFFERSIANRIEQWDRIAHVWSTYESRHTKEDVTPFARGINSIQLFNDGKRWWVITVFWQSEDKDHPLPEKYTH